MLHLSLETVDTIDPPYVDRSEGTIFKVPFPPNLGVWVMGGGWGATNTIIRGRGKRQRVGGSEIHDPSSDCASVAAPPPAAHPLSRVLGQRVRQVVRRNRIEFEKTLPYTFRVTDFPGNEHPHVLDRLVVQQVIAEHLRAPSVVLSESAPSRQPKQLDRVSRPEVPAPSEVGAEPIPLRHMLGADSGAEQSIDLDVENCVW